MQYPRLQLFFAGGSLFVLGIIAAYLVIDIVGLDNKRLSEMVVVELNKRGFNTHTIKAQVDLAEKFDNLESTMNVLHSGTAQAQHGSVGESSLTISLLGKIRELEKKVNALTTEQFLNKKYDATNIGTITENRDPTISQTSENDLASYYQNLENDYQAEDHDPQWSLAINEKIKNIIEKIRQDSNSTASIIGLDCKTSLCRVEMIYNKDDDMGMLELSLLNSLSGEISGSSSTLKNDSEGNASSIVFYFVRQGHGVVRTPQEP